jgi:hypothetical protein
MIVFINKTAENLWKVKFRDIEGKPGMPVFRELRNVPDSLVSLLDPARAKTLEKPYLEFRDEKDKSNRMPAKLMTSEFSGKIIYTLSLTVN